MKRFPWALMVIAILIGVLAPGAALAQDGGVDYPLTVVDDLGREITLEAEPQHIVSLAPANTEILFAVGAGDKVVGRTDFCNYPAEVEDIPSVGGFTADTISVETIVSLGADLVIGSDLHMELEDALNEAGIPLFVLRPRGLKGLYADIINVGLLTNNTFGASMVVSEMQSRIEAVESIVDQVPPDERPTVFYEVWDDPLMTTGTETFIGTIIETAGGMPLFPELAEGYPMVTAEEVIARNPDVIMSAQTHAEAMSLEAISSREGWENISAVQNGRIYLFDDDIISRPGPRVADAIEMVAQALYPDLFE